MIETYLNKRENLKSVFLLLDVRHEPTDDDIVMYNFIVEKGFEPVIIVTKVDKLAKTKILPRVEEFKEFFGIDSVYPFSSQTGYGRDELLELVETIVTNSVGNEDIK